MVDARLSQPDSEVGAEFSEERRTTMDAKRIMLNGVSGATGDYLLALTVEEAAALAWEEQPAPAHLAELNRRNRVKIKTLAATSSSATRPYA